jgi:hypothetical protein
LTMLLGIVYYNYIMQLERNGHIQLLQKALFWFSFSFFYLFLRNEGRFYAVACPMR